MRRSLTGTAVVAVTSVALALPSSAAASRSVTGGYVGGGISSPVAAVPSQYVDVHADGGAVAAVSTTTRRSERWVSVQAADKLGRPVLVAVVQGDTTAGGESVELGRACGTHAARFRLALPGRPVIAYLLAGTCSAGPSTPTTGTVRFTFTR